LNKNWTTGGSVGYPTNPDGSSAGNPYRQFYYTSGTNAYLTLNYKF